MSHIFSFFRELDFGVMPLNSSNVPAAGPRQLDSGLPRNISLSDMPIHPQATTMFNGPFPSRPVSYIYLFYTAFGSSLLQGWQRGQENFLIDDCRIFSLSCLFERLCLEVPWKQMQRPV